MVVDGQDAFVGSDLTRRGARSSARSPSRTAAFASRMDEPAANVAHVALTVASLPASAAGDRADLLVAITEDRLRTEVKRGENQGRTLTHAAVVRDIRTAAEGVSSSSIAETTIKLASDWARPNLKVVAFVQERGAGACWPPPWRPSPVNNSCDRSPSESRSGDPLRNARRRHARHRQTRSCSSG